MHKFSVKNSLKLYEEALKVLPAGTGSNARLMRTVCPLMEPCTFFIDRAKGSHIWDVDNNEYIDYRLGYGPIILGHSYKRVDKAVTEAIKNGTVYALGNELEIELAKKLTKVIPCAKMVRFANSGTEATMAAIRIARGYTKKEKIIKFEGHYHGWHDDVVWSANHDVWKKPPGTKVVDSWGVPKNVSEHVIIEEWNSFTRLEKTIKKHHKQIAAIILEPVMGNAAAIEPAKGFLQHVRRLCTDYNIVLIFDEVKTGFRFAMGGAQEVFNVTPDLACYAKSLGNGYPIAAIVGSEEIMSVIGPGKVMHGGTFSANTVSLAAGLTTLDELKKKDVFNYLNKFGNKLMKGIDEVLTDHKLPHVVQGYPAMFQFLFTKKSRIMSYRDLASCDMDLYAKLHVELLKRGVMFDEDNEEVIFTSFSHRQNDLDHTLKALDQACTAIKKAPRSVLKRAL